MSNALVSDTNPEIQRIYLAMMREIPAWRKVEMVGQMYLATKQLALSGLRQRHPAANEEELQRRLADLLLGPELAALAYGPGTE